jgi:hypothetical protein
MHRRYAEGGNCLQIWETLTVFGREPASCWGVEAQDVVAKLELRPKPFSATRTATPNHAETTNILLCLDDDNVPEDQLSCSVERPCIHYLFIELQDQSD